jgi:hypothetical protein
MSQYTTCPLHMVLKPCPHCDMTKPAQRAVCGDVEQGDKLEECSCGNLRAAGRAHGFTSRGPATWPGGF